MSFMSQNNNRVIEKLILNFDKKDSYRFGWAGQKYIEKAETNWETHDRVSSFNKWFIFRSPDNVLSLNFRPFFLQFFIFDGLESHVGEKTPSAKLGKRAVTLFSRKSITNTTQAGQSQERRYWNIGWDPAKTKTPRNIPLLCFLKLPDWKGWRGNDSVP